MTWKYTTIWVGVVFFLSTSAPLSGEQIFTVKGSWVDVITGLTPRGNALILKRRGIFPLKKVFKIAFQYTQRWDELGGDMPLVALSTGERFRAHILGSNGVELRIRPRWGGEVAISLDFVQAIFFFKRYQSQQTRQKLVRQVLAKAPQEDLLYLADGGTISCMVDTVQAQEITYQIQGLGKRKVKVSKLVALRLAPLGGAIQLPTYGFVSVYTPYGDLIKGTLKDCQTSSVKIQSFSGVLFKVPTDKLEEIYFFHKNLPFLQSLKYSYQFIPGIAAKGMEELYRPRKNRNVRGQAMRIRGRVYRYGIGVQAKTILTFPLGGKYRRLLLTFGLDDSAKNSRGFPVKGRVRVYGDGKVLYESKKFKPFELLSTTLSVKGIQKLQIEIDFTKDKLDILYRVNLVDSVLEREE